MWSKHLATGEFQEIDGMQDGVIQTQYGGFASHSNPGDREWSKAAWTESAELVFREGFSPFMREEANSDSDR